MPTISRVLEHIRPQANGSMKVQERLTDALGRTPIFHNYTAASEAEATVTMNARDMTAQLEEADFRDLLAWVQAKNLPGIFDFTNRDLDLLAGEEQLLVWFATQHGADAITLAWWVESMTPPVYNAIRLRSGFDSDAGTRIQDRAIDLLAVEDNFDAVEKAP